MSKDNIIAGYKGIMELDLNLIEPKYRTETANQHAKEIDTYKGEQYKLKPHLRYENTVERIYKLHQLECSIIKTRSEEKIKEQMKYDKQTQEIYKGNKYTNYNAVIEVVPVDEY
tara:strand:- start:6429 stop:6770 length:342 start_codon:yes stop_codon:yes gene_type:complete